MFKEGYLSDIDAPHDNIPGNSHDTDCQDNQDDVDFLIAEVVSEERDQPSDDHGNEGEEQDVDKESK